MGTLTTTMLIAADGLLNNQGLTVNTDLGNSISLYTGTELISTWNTAVADAIVANGLGTISNVALLDIQTAASDSVPALTNVIPADFTATLGNTNPAGMIGEINDLAYIESGNGNVATFLSAFSMAEGYVDSTNEYINSTNNAELLAPTFTDIDALTTGGITQLTNNPPLLGYDMIKLGQMINLENIDYLGFPWALLKQVIDVGELTSGLRLQLENQGLDTRELLNQIAAGQSIPPSMDAKILRAMQNIRANDLDQVKQILYVTTPNIETMADLLDPVKILPNSYSTLTILVPKSSPYVSADRIDTADPPGAVVVENVYVSEATANASLAGLFEQSSYYKQLIKLVPQNQVIGCLSLTRSLKQIKSIRYVNLQDLAFSLVAIETNSDLDQIVSMKKALPDSVRDNILTELATGTGPNGTLTIYDILGTYAGYTSADSLLSAFDAISELSLAGALDDLVLMYGQISGTIAGDFGTSPVNIPSGPAAGSYGDVNSAITSGLIPAIESNITTIQSSYPDQSAVLVSAFNDIGNQLVTEINNQINAEIDWAELPTTSRNTVLSFTSGLQNLGVDIQPGNAGEYISSIADLSTQSGQAIIASMREGKNLAMLDQAGLGTDMFLSSELIGNIQ